MGESKDEQLRLDFDARVALDGPIDVTDGTLHLGSRESYGRSYFLRSTWDCDTVLAWRSGGALLLAGRE